MVGRLTMELDFFEKSLEACQGCLEQQDPKGWNHLMYPLVTQNESTLPVQRKCQLAGIARSSYYRMEHPDVGGTPEDI